MKTIYFTIVLATLVLVSCVERPQSTPIKEQENVPWMEIADNDQESKEYYMRYLDFWLKNHSLEWSESDGDSMRFYLEKLWAIRENNLKGLDSLEEQQLYYYYNIKSLQWHTEWTNLNDGALAPVLIY